MSRTVISTPTMYNSIGGSLGQRNAFTVHNKNLRRYYSSIDASIYFNGYEIDELIQIQWTTEQQTMPLFGYNSYVWDEVAKGSRMVSGVFAINFVIPDYLTYVLNKAINNEAFTKKRNVVRDKHKPIYPDGFTITIGYGQKDSVIGDAPSTTLENVIVKSCGQARDTQGANLVEMYQFIARDRNYSK